MPPPPIARRTALLRALIEHRRGTAELSHELRDFPWDEEELVELSIRHLSAVLQRLIRGEVSSEEATAWADAVEGRDDIGRAPGQSTAVNQVLFEMSSPEISEDLSTAAPRLLAQLGTGAA